MTYKYNPTPTELRHAYEVAYGEMGIYHLYGALFGHASTETIERLYQEALSVVRQEMEETGTL